MAARPSPRQIEFKIGIRRQSFFLLRQTAIGRSDVPVASPEFYINSVRSFRVPLEKKSKSRQHFQSLFYGSSILWCPIAHWASAHSSPRSTK